MTILRLIGSTLSRVWHYAWLTFRILLSIVLLLALFGTFGLTFGEEWDAVAEIVGARQFDYFTWEVEALAVKVEQTLYGLHPFLSEEDRIAIVRQYMDDLRRAQSLEAEVNRIFTDPTVSDPETASAELRAERDTLRSTLRQRQPLLEAILEGQVAQVLVEQGFSIAGQILPPVSAHFTRVPNLLVVSPRDEIRFDVSINLVPLTVDEIAALEAKVDSERDVSSLVVPLGGIALYPAMVLETSSIPYALDTISHEWLHHYLFAFPLGLEYFNADTFAGETRVINETTASLFGREMSRLVLARYYPDLLPPPPAPPVQTDTTTPATPEPPRFNFGAEMDTTRRRVDELLAEGLVEEAEAYMEERRALFVQNGYLIRKLNQAYFAFYGGYQSGAPGAGGTDPTGAAVQAIRDASPSLHEWMITMRTITTREALLTTRDSLAD